MNLYLAGPMTGIEEFNYPAFNAAATRLGNGGFRVLNPATIETLNRTGKPQTWGWYMRHALRMVLDADGVALLPGWESSRVATLEVKVAESLSMPLWAVEMWLEKAA